MKKSQMIPAFCVNGNTGSLKEGILSKRVSGYSLRRRKSGLFILSFLLVLSFRGTTQIGFISDLSNSGEADSACVCSWSENGVMNYAWGSCSSENKIDCYSLVDPGSSSRGDIGSVNFGQTGISLPAEMLTFYGNGGEEANELFWTTATEVGNDRFDIYHSMDLNNFELMTSLPAVGDAQAESDYHFYHTNIEEGIHYYRLIQVDVDGDEKSSDVVSVTHKKKDTEYSFSNTYPNPAKDQCDFSYNGTDFSSAIKISLYSLKGERVYYSEVADFTNFTEISISTNALNNGVYIINIEQDGHFEMQRLNVMR